MGETRFYPSLTRPVLMGGLEREVMIPLAGLILVLLFGFKLNFLTPAIAACLFLIVLPRLRRLNRRDPLLFKTVVQHIAISGYYSAQAPLRQPRRPRSTF